MTMRDFYSMTIKAGNELRDKVKTEGIAIGEVFNTDTNRYNRLFDYNFDVFQIDNLLGVVDINDTAKDL